VSVVECPICQRRIPAWERISPHRIGSDGRAEPFAREPRESEASWQERLTMAYRPCGDVGAPDTHLLRYDYGDYTPVIIGMVGHPGAGKTILLAAMISRLCSNDPLLSRLGLQVGPLDLAVHQRYVADNVTPLISQRKQLAGTRANARIDFCDALKVQNAAGRSFALTFFDLAGERLVRTDDDENRFYSSAKALIFVVDPESLPKRTGPRNVPGDASFEVALHRLGARRVKSGGSTFCTVAAAVVVAKADLIQFDDQVVSQWLTAGSAEEETDLTSVEKESEDVYAYLSRRGATQWLRPAQECCASTLHFASATNGPASGGFFGETFRQRRVLKPLLSVFAMTGILNLEDPQ
jgi:hypothetical protein